MKARMLINRVGMVVLSAWALSSGVAGAHGGPGTEFGAGASGDGARWASQYPAGMHDGYRYEHRDGPRFGVNDRVDQRQARQQARIHQGLKSGELTKPEARALMHEQRDIRRLERDFLSDGFISRAEFRILDQRLDAASRRIYREKHDDQWRHARMENRQFGDPEARRSRW